jgi:hypothetical protein
VATGGEAEYSDPIRIDFPGRSTGTDSPNGTLRVLERGRVPVPRGNTISQYKGGDPVGSEPIGDLFTFMVDGKPTVTTAGTDDNRGPGRTLS